MNLSRRKLISAGLGISGAALAIGLVSRRGLIPPDARGLYSPGLTLTYAAQRLLGPHALAREFSRSQISKPFANEVQPLGADFQRSLQKGFADWRLDIDGMVARPQSLSVDDLLSLPTRTQITQLTCEEGWSYIAEWTGVELARVLSSVGILPEARYVVYGSIQSDWWESIDLDDAMHPQTLIAHTMNGTRLPVPFGGPLRLRVPRQLGYKSVKYLTWITATNDLRPFGKGLGSVASEYGYSWYAGM